MSATSTFLANALLNATLKGVGYTSPVTVYAALGTTNQSAANDGIEVTGGSYARQALTFGTSASAGSISNTIAATFASMPSCTVASVSIYDASVNGNLLYFDNITSQVVNTGGSFIIPIGAITATLS